MKKLFVFLIGAGLGAYYIWPTRYVEYAAGAGPYKEQIGNHASRVDRLTRDVWVHDATGTWTKRVVMNPNLRRPDITGPQSNTQPDTSPAEKQMRDQADMNAQANQMMDAAIKDATKKQ